VPWADLLWATVVTVVLCLPLAISAWAFLDAARRPSWAWSLAERSQVAWMGVVVAGVFINVLGVAISLWYLLKIRPEVAAAEEGRIGG
jgi:hypothetical protein